MLTTREDTAVVPNLTSMTVGRDGADPSSVCPLEVAHYFTEFMLTCAIPMTHNNERLVPLFFVSRLIPANIEPIDEEGKKSEENCSRRLQNNVLIGKIFKMPNLDWIM